MDELSIDPNQAIGVNIAELVIANEDVAIATAKSLIAQTRQQIDDSGFQQIVLDLVKAVLIYKLGKDKEQELRNHLRIVVFAPLAPQFWGEPYLSPPELGDLGG